MNPDRPSSAVVEQAATWAALLATDEASLADRAACERWAGEHPMHRLALDRMNALDQGISGTDATGRQAIDVVLADRSKRRHRVGSIAVGVLLLAGATWMTANSRYVQSMHPDFATRRGEQRTVQLSDHSEVTLDTDAALDFSSSRTERSLTLFRGQILTRVARDHNNPFVVRTAEGSVTALGTAFTVRRVEGSTFVTVLESHVRICPSDAPRTTCRDFGPAAQTVLRSNGVERLADVDLKTASGWATGWLRVDDQPVISVLAELNRYREEPIGFSKAELAGVHVSGSFPLRDTGAALDAIVSATGLEQSHGIDDVVVHKAAQ